MRGDHAGKTIAQLPFGFDIIDNNPDVNFSHKVGIFSVQKTRIENKKLLLNDTLLHGDDEVTPYYELIMDLVKMRSEATNGPNITFDDFIFTIKIPSGKIAFPGGRVINFRFTTLDGIPIQNASTTAWIVHGDISGPVPTNPQGEVQFTYSASDVGRTVEITAEMSTPQEKIRVRAILP
ncbi:hypothetical protein ACFL54_09950 [Planctomycetota bacterium]